MVAPTRARARILVVGVIGIGCVVAAIAGCDAILGGELNPTFCNAHRDDAECKRTYPDAAPDGPKSCTADQECTAPTGVCDIGATMTCVQCTVADNPCAVATPACVANQCQKCTQHSQCAATSNVCLPDGTCAMADQVAYVQAGGTGAVPCTKAAPCGTLDLGVMANKPTVKIAAGTVADNKTTTIDGKAVTILADPGAKLSCSMQRVILQVQNDGADVRIYDLEITGATGVGNPAISISNGSPNVSLTRVTVDGNQGIGISATAGTLKVSQSTVTLNDRGGISVSGAQFDLTNNFIVNNGGTSATFGGAKIDGVGSVAGSHRLEFNTITGNQTSGTLTAGVVCTTIGVPLTFENNIVFRNGTGMQVEGANCGWSYSDIGQAVAGTGNVSADPMFVSVPLNNFHLQATSPARDAADPAATINVDFDGDARPQGTRSDMGADEFKQ